MPIKNYTTKIDAFVSIGEIQGVLLKNGATKIMIDYESGQPTGIAFGMNGARGFQGFNLPASVEGTLRAFAKEKIKVDREQAIRTAWRNVRDWVLAQMAFVESADAPVEQLFLPHIVDKTGRTLYEVYTSGQLQLTE